MDTYARSLVLAAGAALVLASGVVGCEFEENPVEIDEPPLVLRFTVPADSAINVADPDGIDLVARFNRPFDPAEFTTFRLIPPPVRSRAFSYAVARQVDVLDVVFDATEPVQSWLMDGPDVIGPIVVTLFNPSAPRQAGAISGVVSLPLPGADPDKTLVFLLERNEAPADYTGLVMLERAVVRVLQVAPFYALTRTNSYDMSQLPPYSSYLVVAINDTDGDGRYVPDVDWWGYYRNSRSPRVPLLVQPFVLQGDKEEAPQAANIELVGPGVLDPILIGIGSN